MTIRNVLLVLGALYAGNAVAASPFTVYFNGSSSCTSATNAGSAALSNGSGGTNNPGTAGDLVISPPPAGQLAFAGCGNTGGQQLTFGPAQPLQGPASALASGSNVPGAFSVLPLNAQSCTVAIVTTAGTGTATGPASGYVCGPSGSQSCAPATLIAFNASFTNTGAGASSYQATVTCQAAAGASPATLTSQVTVNQSGNSGGTPAANFTFTTNGLTANFTDTSTDPGGTINAWSWDFGDSTTSTQQNPSHTYAASGTYSVKETVTDSVSGAQNSKTQSVAVSNAPSCTTGATGDVAGYTAICSGYMNKGPTVKLGPSPYTFPFVFGSNWPGSYAGFPLIFTMAGTQFLSIPFTPAPGHTIGITENQTYTLYAITFSVSTSPGLFNNGTAGNGVLCAQTNNPTLQMSSNNTVTNCPNLNPGTQYWFNVIPAKYSNTQGKWVKSCSSSSCQLGLNLANIN